jgi:hypothetical protein
MIGASGSAFAQTRDRLHDKVIRRVYEGPALTLNAAVDEALQKNPTLIIGGMITSTIHVLIITPVIFYIMKLRALRTGTLRPSLMTH